MEDLMYDPVKEMRSSATVIRTFSVEETISINSRIDNAVAEADRSSKRDEAIAIEKASRAFLTF